VAVAAEAADRQSSNTDARFDSFRRANDRNLSRLNAAADYQFSTFHRRFITVRWKQLLQHMVASTTDLFILLDIYTKLAISSANYILSQGLTDDDYKMPR
jgi:hypothetical protein